MRQDVWIKGTKRLVRLSNYKRCLGMFVLSKGGEGRRSPLGHTGDVHFSGVAARGKQVHCSILNGKR